MEEARLAEHAEPWVRDLTVGRRGGPSSPLLPTKDALDQMDRVLDRHDWDGIPQR